MDDLFNKRVTIVSQSHLIPRLRPERESKLKERRERSSTEHRLKQINQQIRALKNERRELLKSKRYQAHASEARQYWLYALRLEGGRYYVGFTNDVDRRFNKHAKGKGAVWTRLYKPIEVIETRQIPTDQNHRAGYLEDDMTFEYAMKYGAEYVRGGGYCQMKPRWPELIVQNDRVY